MQVSTVFLNELVLMNHNPANEGVLLGCKGNQLVEVSNGFFAKILNYLFKGITTNIRSVQDVVFQTRSLSTSNPTILAIADKISTLNPDSLAAKGWTAVQSEKEKVESERVKVESAKAGQGIFNGFKALGSEIIRVYSE